MNSLWRNLVAYCVWDAAVLVQIQVERPTYSRKCYGSTAASKSVGRGSIPWRGAKFLYVVRFESSHRDQYELSKHKWRCSGLVSLRRRFDSVRERQVSFGVMMKTIKPRNKFVAQALFRKAGSHKKPHKALRKAQKQNLNKE